MPPTMPMAAIDTAIGRPTSISASIAKNANPIRAMFMVRLLRRAGAALEVVEFFLQLFLRALRMEVAVQRADVAACQQPVARMRRPQATSAKITRPAYHTPCGMISGVAQGVCAVLR
jgi:hypothetical protein